MFHEKALRVLVIGFAANAATTAVACGDGKNGSAGEPSGATVAAQTSWAFTGTVDQVLTSGSFAPGVDFYPTPCGHVPATYAAGYTPPTVQVGMSYGVIGTLLDVNGHVMTSGCPDRISNVTLIGLSSSSPAPPPPVAWSFSAPVDQLLTSGSFAPGVDFYPTPCGHVPATYAAGYTPPTIQVGTSYGVIGTLLDVNGNVMSSGCPDRISNVTLIGPSASPSTPGNPPPPPPPPPPSSGTCSPASYTAIVNGSAWPSTFCPYSKYPWNNPLPASPANVDGTNTARLGTYLGRNAPNFFSRAADGNDYSHPVYLASSSDPDVATSCGSYQYGCNAAFPATIKIPSKARAAAASDAHLGVIQPNGDEYDFWGASFNGTTLSAHVGARSSVLTTGVPAGMSATSGASLAAGVIRFQELAAGVIPHALFVVMPCTTSVVYPGTTNAFACPDGQGVPVGAHVHLKMSDAAIDALSIPSDLKVVLHAMHQYGAFVEDTGGYGNLVESSGGPILAYESATPYLAFGTAFPGVAWAQSQPNWTCNASTCGGTPIPYTTLGAGQFEVLQPCYAQGTCSN